MSYDLMTFESSAAPRTQAKFDAWYAQQLKWDEGHSYNDPAVSSPTLQAWFAEMRQTFPPMNGPLALSNEEFDKLTSEEEARVTDYSIGRSVIYMAFAWSVTEEAEKTVRELARKYKVGFYHPGSGEVRFFGDTRRFDLTTNSSDKRNADWNDIWLALDRLDTDKGEFVTIEEKPPTGEGLYMQAFYDRCTYHVELQLVSSKEGIPQYSREVADFGEAAKIFRDWYVWGELPDFTAWSDAKIAPPMIDRKIARTNSLIKSIVAIVGAAVIIGIIAYILKDFLS